MDTNNEHFKLNLFFLHVEGVDYWLDHYEGKRVRGNGPLTRNGAVVYTGEWENYQPHGEGEQKFSNGAQYKGQYENGNLHGRGKLVLADGTIYEGEFKDGKPHGAGIKTLPNKFSATVHYENGQKHGHNIELLPDGRTYIGEYQHGEKHGVGSYQSADETTHDQPWNGNLLGHGTNGHDQDGTDFGNTLQQTKKKNLHVAFFFAFDCFFVFVSRHPQNVFFNSDEPNAFSEEEVINTASTGPLHTTRTVRWPFPINMSHKIHLTICSNYLGLILFQASKMYLF